MRTLMYDALLLFKAPELSVSVDSLVLRKPSGLVLRVDGSVGPAWDAGFARGGIMEHGYLLR